jgi:class 3 adenylate cyclase
MSTSLTHGFLFADLRGYTSYLDRRGAVAASALLDRFRALVRSAVAAHNGAEIRTEGDSFYVVFPSASMAVACALEIVRAAADDVVHDDPILVGVGVHAGEALETPEGPVGTAVNIAARLCAIAGPGEVVVSDTVRALTRSVGSAGFVALGRKPIKGLDESLSLYRAVPAGTVVARPRRRRLPLAAAGTAGLAAVALLGFVLAATRLGPSPAASADPGAAASVSAEASPDPSPLPTGRYTSTRFAVPFSIDLGEGWDLRGDTADLVVFEHDEFPYGAIGIGIVAASLDPPCPTSEPVFIGERPVDLIDWLTTLDWLDAEVPRPHNIGRYVGRAVDIEIPTSDRWTCPEGRREAVHLFRLGEPPRGGEFGETLEAAVGERWRIIAVDADGRTIMVAIGSPYDDVATLWTLTEPLIQTLEFAER